MLANKSAELRPNSPDTVPAAGTGRTRPVSLPGPFLLHNNIHAGYMHRLLIPCARVQLSIRYACVCWPLGPLAPGPWPQTRGRGTWTSSGRGRWSRPTSCLHRTNPTCWLGSAGPPEAADHLQTRIETTTASRMESCGEGRGPAAANWGRRAGEVRDWGGRDD